MTLLPNTLLRKVHCSKTLWRIHLLPGLSTDLLLHPGPDFRSSGRKSDFSFLHFRISHTHPFLYAIFVTYIFLFFVTSTHCFLTCSVLHAFIIDGGYFFSNVLSLKTQRFVPDFLTGFDRFFSLERRSFKIIWRTLIYIVI